MPSATSDWDLAKMPTMICRMVRNRLTHTLTIVERLAAWRLISDSDAVAVDIMSASVATTKSGRLLDPPPAPSGTSPAHQPVSPDAGKLRKDQGPDYKPSS